MVIYFSKRFNKLSVVWPGLSGVSFWTLTVEDSLALTTPILLEVLDEVVP